MWRQRTKTTGSLVQIYDVNVALRKIEDWEKTRLFSILKGERVSPKPKPIPLQLMITDAMQCVGFLSEIYEFESAMTDRQLITAFRKNFRHIVGVVRSSGEKIYSNEVIPDEDD